MVVLPPDCTGLLCRNKNGDSFFGQELQSHHKFFRNSNSAGSSRRQVLVTATVKRTKDPILDKVIQRQKKVKVVNKVKNILVRQPGKVMTLRDMSRYRQEIGLPGEKRFVSLLRKFPGVFKLFQDGAGPMFCTLTSSAVAQFEEEMSLKKQMEDTTVFRLRKLLMMSVDRKILISKIVHLKFDLGLPDNFEYDYVSRYPELFTKVATPLGPALEVNRWDPELAMTFEEIKHRNNPVDYEEITVSGRVPRFPRIPLPGGCKLPRKEKGKLIRFLNIPFISPYSEEGKQLVPSSKEAERRAVACVQELLHLTLEEKTLVDHLTHFRSDFRFSQRLRGVLIRHPEVFYVSFKGDRNSVFLREAYNDQSQLIEKDPLVGAREKLAALVRIDQAAMKVLDDDSDDSEDDGSWSDDDDLTEETKIFLEQRRKYREVARTFKRPVEPW